MDMSARSGLPLHKGKTRKQVQAREARQAAKVVKTVRNQAVERADFSCETCGQWTGTWGHAHHKVKRSQGGTWTLDNIAYVCAGCHAEIHGGTA